MSPLSKIGYQHTDLHRPQFTERHPLLVIFHDPPGFHEYADPLTGKKELHNTWLVSSSAVVSCLSADIEMED